MPRFNLELIFIRSPDSVEGGRLASEAGVNIAQPRRHSEAPSVDLACLFFVIPLTNFALCNPHRVRVFRELQQEDSSIFESMFDMFRFLLVEGLHLYHSRNMPMKDARDV